MARNLFGQNRNRQSERERQAREQEARRRQAQEQQRAALAARGDGYALPDINDEFVDYDDYEDDPEVLEAPVPVDLPKTYRVQDTVNRSDAQYQALLADLDELRGVVGALIEDRDMNQVLIKQQAAEIAQLHQMLEKSTNDSQQAAQAAALNENRTRQFIEELEERLDDAMRPVRSLQSHVTDLLEQNRRKVDDSTQNKERFGEIGASVEHLSAQTDRTSAIAHSLRDGLDALRGEIDELRRDILRTDDATKIVDQDSRRRVQGVTDTIDGFGARLDEIRADIAHLDESIDDTRRSMVHIDPSLDELRTAEQALRADMNKLQSVQDDRYDQVVDSIEEQRQETDARFDQLRHTLEERIERLNERLEESNDSIRETGYKISEINSQIEELRQQDAALHRDTWYLHEQRVRVRLEQVQEELDLATAQRRDAEGEARVGLGTRIRRRRGDAASE
ncbi:MAG: hypothetical protein M9934_01230 [Thermomicrobiales bacterium]|nr:hypothetical protein [Thermomicrobiales bacterium]MCO5226888.1 hypothetical protein [Thermomicrobiales bacterium]